MSDVGAWTRSDARLAFIRHDGSVAAAARVAAVGCVALVAMAPFETLQPVLALPGQALSSVEVVLATVLGMFALSVVRTRTVPRLPMRDAAAWALFAGICVIAALAAPLHQLNALHMAARIIAAGAIWTMCVAGLSSERHVRLVAVAIVASGVLVAGLVVLDYTQPVLAARLFAPFREGVAVVGTQVRASGPFQYPTITSMYLEVAFAIGLGLLLDARGGTLRALTGRGAVLVLIAQAIILTFTRAGLITMALCLAVAGVWQWRRHGLSRETRALGVVALVVIALIASSRSFETLRLRFTTEGQSNWYSARIDAPPTLSFETGQIRRVQLRVTNDGRTTWDPASPDAVQLSYHWIAADSDRVVAWENDRTPFSSRMPRGAWSTLEADVRAPGKPGTYRLLWDIEQPKRLWFSTEPGAVLWFTKGVVTGPERAMPLRRSGPERLPRAAVRPGRGVLWGAALRMTAERPLLGVGPDNYRLRYGPYASLGEADPRVHSNNMYIEVLAGAGLLGAAALLWLVLRTSRHALIAFQASALGCGIAAGCVAIGAHGLLDSFLSFTGTYILIAIVIGLAAASGTAAGHHAHRL